MKCKNCNTLLLEDSKLCNQCGGSIEKLDCKIEYFAISRKRLVLLSFFTLGIYETYWFYKNWSAVKKAENLNISPFGRTFFVIFYCYSLFKKVFKSAEINGYSNPYSPGWLATAYIAFPLLIEIGLNTNPYLACIIYSFLSVFPLLAVQTAINFNNKKIKGYSDLKKEFSCAEVIIVIIGLAFFSLASYSVASGLNEASSDLKSANKYSKTDLINLTIKRVKNEVVFPEKLDEKTTLIDVSAV